VIAERADRVSLQPGETRRAWKNKALPIGDGFKLLVDDLGDRDSVLPVLAGTRNVGKESAAHEAELAALEYDAAVACRKAAEAARLAMTWPTASWPWRLSLLASK
jgi:hypothetical protein